MPIQNAAGKPFRRPVDPVAPVVYPNGTQAKSAFSPFLVYNYGGVDAYSTQIAPKGDFVIELLFFGSDYPLKVSGFQLFNGYTYFSGSTPLAPQQYLVFYPSFPLGGPTFNTALNRVSTILPTADSVRYQQIVTSTTATNNVRVSGFPYKVTAFNHELYATDRGYDGGLGPGAPFSVSLDVTLNSGTNIGPGHFADFGDGGGFVIPRYRCAVMLWEKDFTQAIADAGYTFTGTLFGVATDFDVVGLWAANGYEPSPT